MRRVVAFDFDTVNFFRASVAFWRFHDNKAVWLEITEDELEFISIRAADDFIANAPGDYGLVWDGDSLNTCSGHFGEYLRWNSPHKASFYLRAGLPLIVWRCSALAPIVKELGVGILIDRIEDIDRRLSAITPEERATMTANALSVAQRLSTGAFFKDALKEAIGRIE